MDPLEFASWEEAITALFLEASGGSKNMFAPLGYYSITSESLKTPLSKTAVRSVISCPFCVQSNVFFDSMRSGLPGDFKSAKCKGEAALLGNSSTISLRIFSLRSLAYIKLFWKSLISASLERRSSFPTLVRNRSIISFANDEQFKSSQT